MSAVVVFGGVGRHAVAQLLRTGQDVIAVVRDPAKGTPLVNAGARVVTHDLQYDDPRRLARHLKGAESVLFAAGVRYGTPLDQLRAVDHGGAVAATAAAREVGADRFVHVSAIGADSAPPTGFDDAWWTAYYTAKHAADEALRTSGLRWTVTRPGALLGTALRRMGRFDEAITAHQSAAVLYREVGYPHGEGTALNNLGLALQQARRFEEAITAYQTDLAICQEIGDHYGTAATLNDLPTALQEEQRFEERSPPTAKPRPYPGKLATGTARAGH